MSQGLGTGLQGGSFHLRHLFSGGYSQGPRMGSGWAVCMCVCSGWAACGFKLGCVFAQSVCVQDGLHVGSGWAVVGLRLGCVWAQAWLCVCVQDGLCVGSVWSVCVQAGLCMCVQAGVCVGSGWAVCVFRLGYVCVQAGLCVCVQAELYVSSDWGWVWAQKPKKERSFTKVSPYLGDRCYVHVGQYLLALQDFM